MDREDILLEEQQIDEIAEGEASEKRKDSFVDRVKRNQGMLLAMLSGFIFILTFSSWTSPIMKKAYGCDSSFFSMVGRAILEGKVMYRDFFDIKGPVFFFWEAFGQLIHRDRLGVFSLQIICIFGATAFLYKICNMYELTAQKIVFTFAVFYFIYAATIWGGNSVEEFCMPLNLGCIYFALRYLKGKSEDLTISYFFGITFGVCFLSKITVCAPMAAALLVVLGALIARKDYASIGKCAIDFLLGAVTIIIPVFVYYALRGALGDMIQCVFITAYARGTDYYEPFSIKWELYLTCCYAGIVLWFFKRRERGYEKWMLLSLTVVTFVALHLGTPFDYYFITTLPLVAYISILMCSDIQKLYEKERTPYMLRRHIRKIIIAAAGIAVICCANTERVKGRIEDNYDVAINGSEVHYYNLCKELYDLIPETDKVDGVYCIESDMIFFEVNQTLPTNKYPVNMPYFCELYEPAEGEILDVIENHTPKWVVTSCLEDLENETIMLAIYNNYTKVYDNPANELWRRN